jgi:hypothetical protein
MVYDGVVAECGKLHYREKLRLAQLLIQLARKEEELENPEPRGPVTSTVTYAHSKPVVKHEATGDVIGYVAARIAKLQPSRKQTLVNSVKAMFQFQGGISDDDVERIIAALIKRKLIHIDAQNRVEITQPH